ncbi:MAG: hypothetical protein WCJ89_03725 [Actinomycetes bacterium]
MRIRPALTVVVSLLLISGVTSAVADTITPTRDEQIASIHSKYDPMFEDLSARLTKLATKVKLDTNLARQYKAVLLDFTTMRGTINDGLASANGDVEAMGQLAEEETGEFNSTIYNLEMDAARIKTITCVKVKTIKKVSGITPKCPTGYKKK